MIDPVATPSEQSDEPFERLLGELLDGEPTTDEIDALEALLVDSPERAGEASQRYAEHRLLLHLLGDRGSTAEDVMQAVRSEHQRQQSRRVNRIMRSVGEAVGEAVGRHSASRLAWGRWGLGAVAALVLAVGLLPLWKAAGDVDEPSVASVLLCEGCEWEGAGVVEEGQRLPAGTLALRTGLFVVRFEGGAEMALQGPAVARLSGPGAAELIEGNVTIRAPEEAAGFVLSTPSTSLEDLGTEFAVRVAGDGSTALDVLEGAVAVREPGKTDGPALIFEADKAVSIARDDAAVRPIERLGRPIASLIEAADPPVRWELTTAYEGFFYDEGTLPLRRSRRGKGWNGPWRRRSEGERQRGPQNTANELNIVHGQLNVTWPVPGGRHGHLELPAGHSVFLREMAEPIDLGRDATYYVSFMLRAEPSETTARHDEFRLTFRSSDEYWGDCVSLAVPARKGPRVLHGGGVGFRGRQTAAPGETLFCVAKIEAAASGEDVVSFRVISEDESLGALEPREWDVITRGFRSSASLETAVITSVGPASRLLDELRVGPSWRSVALVIQTGNSPVETAASDREQAAGNVPDEEAELE